MTDAEIKGRAKAQEEIDWRPSPKEKLHAQGEAILRVAKELREWISAAPADDEQAKSLRSDIETLEEIGHWLSGVAPISGEGIRA